MVTAYDISHDWEDPEELHGLLQSIREQRHDANVRRIRYAYFLAEQAHKGQTRSSGEPYIIHPLAVARILVDLRMDDDSICAALLHDVLEDCPEVTAEQLLRIFGEDVLHLVEGVTKLKFTHQEMLTDRQRAAAETTRTAETLRKMLLAMAQDFRVMVIKLADRLHNMQTLGALPPEKRTRIASETLDIYAPLAARLGIWQIKWQLEDLSFQALHPHEYAEVRERVSKTRKQREDELQEAILVLKRRFEERGVKIVEIRGRPKHLYSIFNKMVKQGVKFEEIYDLLALRIIVESIPDCYVALGIVHEAYGPIPSLFYDYIARPKPNGYQSLHTKVLGPSSQPLEIQIRTLQMHEIAEHGVAAHWTYKEGKTSIDETKRLSRLREQLFDWSSDSRSSSDFLRSVSTDLFAEQVFVFTPKGDVIDLPKDSTPVDFAFRVHTQLGLTLVGAKINGSIVPLPTKLQNGDVVELITRSNAQPSLDWLEFTKSAHARSRIRAFFRKITKTDDAQRGKEALDKELKSLGLDPRQYLGDKEVQRVADQMDSCEGPADVFARVATGQISVQSVVAKLRGTVVEQPTADTIQLTKTKEGKVALTAGGMENVLVSRGKCCNPIPGDEVVGYVTRGRGIVIHRKVCPNAMAYQSSEPERLIPYSWPPDGNVYTVGLKIVSINRTGLLMDISTVLGESKTNVSALKVKTLQNHTAEIDLTIDVRDTEHLSQLMAKISNFGDIISILRMFGRVAKS
ncbi:RelA/SpoT family protein [Fimbriimonas ginsengisoli]|uniref:(P)ppgpp synthetase i, spot/rela n=1 Tax=Fimbriimonas ginsengisoli Gsoil 348 TaxID=661478 RepID=A0A068NYC9_FIMGI|nr:bifunctional (p)ppGpp synthetase/guanosine-3',5'-bis(diphosphate) 3'-pyrophosphohydrolase [Fimbriimonas ginsengisoli]AIE86859.1 (p)ppgpp synthetase i, spot/rela [Fimbriimonas ginsengisoli Gsoil 348]